MMKPPLDMGHDWEEIAPDEDDVDFAMLSFGLKDKERYLWQCRTCRIKILTSSSGALVHFGSVEDYVSCNEAIMKEALG